MYFRFEMIQNPQSVVANCRLAKKIFQSSKLSTFPSLASTNIQAMQSGNQSTRSHQALGLHYVAEKAIKLPYPSHSCLLFKAFVLSRENCVPYYTFVASTSFVCDTPYYSQSFDFNNEKFCCLAKSQLPCLAIRYPLLSTFIQNCIFHLS